ncbi:hypothetical protein NL676_007024 [Syzygium grande]|nr:hypothetical protein NL676_007024 [Syzygium grande]
MGLDEEGYGIVRANILSTEPLPNLNRVYAMVVQEGHDAESCFQLIGYPEWWGNRPRGTFARQGSGQKRGNRGRHNKGGGACANVSQATGVDGGRGVVMNSDQKGLSGLNDEQWVTFLGMLSSHQNGVPERLTVELPDGEKTMVVKEGTVLLGGDLKL